MIELYLHPHMPNHWIGIDTKTDEAWVFPASFNGWLQKQPFIGYRDRLEKAPDINNWVLGIPRELW